jgi:methionyl-tRNA synthetase
MSRAWGRAVDPIRYFLLKHIRTTRDGDFCRERLIIANDHELADQLGNLVHRTSSLIGRYRAGTVPPPRSSGSLEAALAEQVQRTEDEVGKAIEGFALHEGLESIWRLIALANRYVEQTKPWKLGKVDGDDLAAAQLDTVLYTLADVLQCIGELLLPFLPQTGTEILRRLNVTTKAGATIVCGRLIPLPAHLIHTYSPPMSHESTMSVEPSCAGMLTCPFLLVKYKTITESVLPGLIVTGSVPASPTRCCTTSASEQLFCSSMLVFPHTS